MGSQPLQLPFLLALTALVLAAAPAWSGGIGGSFTFSHGDAEVEDSEDLFRNLQSETNHWAFGFTYDTNLASNRLVNYRISANVQGVQQDLEQRSGIAPGQPGVDVEIEGVGFSLNQLLGFGFVRTPQIRVFAGPSIHLGVNVFDDKEDVAGSRTRFEEVLFTAGIGPELGVNYNIGRRLTVSFTGFYRYGFQLMGFDDPFQQADLFDDSNEIFAGGEHRVGFTTAIYFRFLGDQYSP